MGESGSCICRSICLPFQGNDQVDSWEHRVQDWNSLLPDFRDSREVVLLSADPGLEQGYPPSHWLERDRSLLVRP